MHQRVVAIVPAAGLGRRFGTSVRKPFARIGDMPVLVHTLRRLQGITRITEIIPVLRQEDIDKGQELLRYYNLDKITRIVPGGEERQDSVYSALRVITTDCLVVIHDGVRPLVTERLVDRLFAGLEGSDGVAPGVAMKDTLKEVDGEGFVLSTVKRESFVSIQTPQVFPFRVIHAAYDRAMKDGFYATDDAALVERIGGRVKIVEGDPLNVKVTTAGDIHMVESALSRIGLLKTGGK